MSLNPKTFSEGWTQSEITMFDICPEKWRLNYDLLLSGMEPNLDFMIGTAWHKCLAEMYENGGEVPKIHCAYEEGTVETTDSSALMEQWEKILGVYAIEYARIYKDEFANLQVEGIEQEIDLTIPWKGTEIRLRGVVDLRGILLGKHTVWDHKTMSGMNGGTARGWQFRFQFMFYLWLVLKATNTKVDRFIVNGLIKPTTRIRQNESLNGYLNRLATDIRTDKSKFFYRESLILTKDKLQYFESNILAPKLNRIAILQEAVIGPTISALLGPNTGSCIQYGKCCQYLEVCEGKIKADRLPQRKVKHSEI